MIWADLVFTRMRSHSIHKPATEFKYCKAKFDSVYIKRQVSELKLNPVQIYCATVQSMSVAAEVQKRAHRFFRNHLVICILNIHIRMYTLR